MKKVDDQAELTGADTAGSKAHARAPDGAGGAPVITIDSELFGDVDVSVQAVLGQGRLTVRSLLDLREGALVDLDTPLDGVVDLNVNGKLVARGEIVAVGDRFGVRITELAAERG